MLTFYQVDIDDTSLTRCKDKHYDKNYHKINFKANIRSKRQKVCLSASEEKKVKIPSEFIEHILTLGFDKNDAKRLYDQRDDWLGVHTGGQLFCTKYGCQFFTKVNSDELFEHCRNEHKWKDYPCDHVNCNYVAYSSLALHHHGRTMSHSLSDFIYSR